MAIDPIVIRFATAGLPEVSAAFEQTAAKARRFEDEMSRTSQRGSRSRVTDAEREEREKSKLAARSAKDAEKLEKQKTALAEREARARLTAEERNAQAVSKAAIRAAEAEKREIEKIEEQKLRMKVRAAERAAQEGERINARMAKIQNDVFREEERRREKLATGLSKTANRGLSSLGSTIRGVASMAGGAAALAGGFEFATAFRNEANDERAVSQLINSATSNGVVAPGANRANILQKLSKVSIDDDVKRGDLIEGVQNYVALAGADQFGNAMANSDFFAKLSTASGTSFKDITGAAGILQAQNKNLGPAEMQQMMLDIMAQGKQGAVEIKDLASQAGKLGSTRGLYEGSATENQRKLLALAQITRTEGASAEESATAVADLGKEAVGKAAKSTAPQWLRNAVDSKTGKIKGGVDQLIESALIGTGGNLGELNHVFGKLGSGAFNRLAPIFNDAGGGEKGLEAVRAEMAPLMKVRGSMSDLNDQFAQAMDSPGKKLETSINAISTQMENAMAPALESFSKKLSDPEVQRGITSLISSVGKLAEFLAENPLKGIGYVIAAKVTADIAQAAIGAGIKSVLESVVKAAVSGTGGAPTLSAGGKAGIVAATGIAAVVGTVAGINEDVAGQAAAGGAQALHGASAVITAANARRAIAGGKITAGDVAQLQTEAQAAEKRQAALAAGSHLSLGEAATAAVGYATFQDKSVNEMLQVKQQENARALKEATDEVNLLKKAAQDAAAALGKMSGGASAVPPVTAGQPAQPIGSSARSG